MDHVAKDKENVVLGLDLGTNSIGWALIKDEKEKEIVDLGVRIFPKAVEEKNPTPKNKKRRDMRLLRRVLRRRSGRRRALMHYLIQENLLPQELKNHPEPEKLLNDLGEPYQLRSEALDRALKPYELGRALLHLGARRGFLSARTLMLRDLLDDPDFRELKSDPEQKNSEAVELKSQKEKDNEKEVKQGIAKLQKEVGEKTLGQYLYSLPVTQRKRNHYTARQMYQDELAKIIAAQQPHHPQLTEDFSKKIEDIIFFQRKIDWDKKTVGKCTLEPKCYRALEARLEFQKYRYWQDLHNISYTDLETGEVIWLTPEQKRKIANLLENQKSLTWSKFKKKLGISRSCKINLEESKKGGLIGNQTACSLRKIYPAWDKLSNSEQEALVEDLLSFQKVKPLKNRLIDHWHCSTKTTRDLENLRDLIDFSCENVSLRCALSLKALRKLLPLMIEKNLSVTEAKKEAGYDPITTKNDEVLDLLPPPPVIPNPIVQKALYEVRKLVNAVIKTYGKPDAIHVELPRDFASSKKQKEQYQKQQNKNKKANDEAAEQYKIIREKYPHRNLPEKMSKNDKLKYRLWLEQEKKCIYSGLPISQTQLFSAAVEIDHIWPYSQTCQDDYMNKVVCFATENRAKGNRIPYKAFSGDKYDAICLRANKLYTKIEAKKKKFFTKEIDSLDDFISSQLTDTRYISKEVQNYLKKLFVKSTNIIPTRGATTAQLRHQWGLNSILSEDGEKNRDDHRHHAIDAVVIALTNRSLYQKLATTVKRANNPNQSRLDNPWPTFRPDVREKINQIIVSHATNHKLTGALHEETAYGIQKNDGGDSRTVYRILLNEDFNDTNVSNIVDPSLKELINEHLAKFGGNSKVAFAKDNPNPLCKHPSQAPIRHVRIIAKKYNPKTHYVRQLNKKCPEKETAAYPFRNNHHVEILQSGTNPEDYKSEVISTYEAANRVRRLKQPAIRQDHGSEWHFIMALHVNDMVEVTQNGITNLYRVQTISTDQISLRLHTAATITNNKEKILSRYKPLIKKYQAKSVKINILGKKLNKDQKPLD